MQRRRNDAQPIYSPITHQRITVGVWLWTKEKASNSPRGSPPTQSVASSISRPRSAIARTRPPSNDPATATWKPGGRARRATEPELVRPSSAHAVHPAAPPSPPPREMTGQRPAPPAENTHNAHKHPELRWRDPLLLQLADESDLELLLYYESKLVQAHAAREECLASVRELLKTQKFNRDRIRAHNGPGRDALRELLVYNARTTLASLLANLRVSCAKHVLALHNWACELPSLSKRWDAPDQAELLRRADVQIVFPFVAALLTQLDYAPVPAGSDPLLLHWCVSLPTALGATRTAG